MNSLIPGVCKRIISNYCNYQTPAGICLGNEFSVSGRGKVIIDSNCIGGTITIRGFFDIEDDVGGGFTGIIVDQQRFSEDQSLASITGSVGSVAGNVVGSVGSVADITNITSAITTSESNIRGLDGYSLTDISNQIEAGGQGLNLEQILSSGSTIDQALSRLDDTVLKLSQADRCSYI